MVQSCIATPIDTSEGKICVYCGRLAKYVYQNGLYYCEAQVRQCPVIKNKIRIHKYTSVSETAKPYHGSSLETCAYGCGQPPKYILQNGKKVCSNKVTGCPAVVKRIFENKSPRRPLTELNEEERKGKTCEFCGGQAVVVFYNGRYCCAKNAFSCPVNRKKGIVNLLKAYRENPHLIEKQREIGFEVHNRPEVKKKKSEKMKQLHQDPEFREKYMRGIRKRRKK